MQPPTKSEALFAEACRYLPGGVSRNTIYRSPHPFYVSEAKGCRIVDVEGKERIDFANNMCSLIHGHAHPAVIHAVTEQLARGTAFTMGTEAEIRYARMLCERVRGFDKIRFVNSGTEAVMAVIKAARAFTGRPMIAKAEGAYHGSYDFAETSQTANPSNWGDEDNPARVPVAYGTPRAVLDNVVVFPFNDTARTLALLDRYADQIACVLIDPMPHRVGLMPATVEFIQAVFDWTRKHGALMAYDEVITFRTSYEGAQELYPVRPDLTALGKIIGGGFPVGAVAGRDDVMQVFDPRAEKVILPLSGTFSANPITMTAGRITMELFDRAAVERLNALGETARRQIREAIRVSDIPACVTGAGSLLRIHLGRTKEPTTYREAWTDKTTSALVKKMLDYAADHGILLINTGTVALSTVMTQAEIDRLSEVMLGAFRFLKPHFPDSAG